MDLNAPQPAPSRGEGDEVWPTIFANDALVLPDWLKVDMRARHEIGIAKYGTPLRVWNERDCVVDAYQEALDLAVYVQQARCRLPVFTLGKGGVPLFNTRHNLDLVFHAALQAACRLGELARRQSVPTTKEASR
ncbi:MAG: hypothetical protein Q8K32_31255 [Archangium sp.]|nr:hypothetical protein [Archangium sp.]